MPVISDNTSYKQIETYIRNFVKNGGHFVVVSDDRLFSNVLRKTLTTQLGLNLSSITVVTAEGRVMKTVKEMSVKKKKVLVLMEAVLDHVRMDDLIRKLKKRVRNALFIIITTESEIHRLALLREEGFAESWLIKPIDINTLLGKIASNIKPPGEIEKLLSKAEDCLKNQAYRMALSVCRRVFAIQPDNPGAAMIMGDAYKALDKIDDMVDAYEQASYMGELNFDPLKRLEKYFNGTGDKRKRLQYIERMDGLSPLNIDRKVEIGATHLELGNDEEAREYFQEALQVITKEDMGDMCSTATRIGDLYAKLNREEAEDYYRKALSVRDPRSRDMALFNSLGIALRKQGRWEDAVAEYKKAIKIVDTDEVLYYNLALAYSDGDKIVEAYKCLGRALRLNPDFCAGQAVACFNIGNIFHLAGKDDEAKRFLGMALEANPDYKAAKRLLDRL